MGNMLLYRIGETAACRYAETFLNQKSIASVDHPTPEVTHILLDVPSFDDGGKLRGGRALEPLLQMLPENVTVIGGNLDIPILDGCRKLDLLRDERYLAQNAAITAECALRVAGEKLPAVLMDSQVLVIGWGRIGKCLAFLLKALGARVTVSARREADLGMIRALGFSALKTQELSSSGYRVVFNTVPAMVLPEEPPMPSGCLKIDLASKPGMAGQDVIWARGLPGVWAPESSGRLIFERILRLSGEG